MDKNDDNSISWSEAASIFADIIFSLSSDLRDHWVLFIYIYFLILYYFNIYYFNCK